MDLDEETLEALGYGSPVERTLLTLRAFDGLNTTDGGWRAREGTSEAHRAAQRR